MNVGLLLWKSKKFFNLKILVKFIICGLLSSLLFPPFFILPIGFIVFPFLFFLLINEEFQNNNKLFHFNSGLAYGIGMNFVVLIWIKEPFLIDQNTTNLSFFSYLLVIYCSIYFGLSFIVISYFKNSYSKLLLIPVLFVLSEIFKENFFYGFPWVTFALVHSSNNVILNLIYYIGTYGLSYFTILVFLIPASIILYYKKSPPSIILKSYILVSLTIVLFCFILIVFRFENITNKEKFFLNVSMVQLNLSQINRTYKTTPENRLKQIIKIISQDNSDLLIFAENSYPYLITNLKDLNFMANSLNKNQSIIIGATKKEDSNFFNTLISIEKNNIQEFAKIKLVPFGEFLPFRKFLHFLDPIVGKSDFRPGDNIRLIKTSENLKIIPIICYEIIFFNDLINKKNINSELLVNITNDAWFGDLSGPYQHFYLSRMRAAEFNKPLIRVSNNGISAIIDNYGFIIDYIPLNKRAIKNSQISIPHFLPNLIYYHPLILVFLFLIFIVAILINRRFND